MFAISKHHYLLSYGGASSPLATDEERKIFCANEGNTTIKIEEKLEKIPLELRRKLIAYIRGSPSSAYKLQDIRVLLLHRK